MKIQTGSQTASIRCWLPPLWSDSIPRFMMHEAVRLRAVQKPAIAVEPDSACDGLQTKQKGLSPSLQTIPSFYIGMGGEQPPLNGRERCKGSLRHWGAPPSDSGGFELQTPRVLCRLSRDRHSTRLSWLCTCCVWKDTEILCLRHCNKDGNTFFPQHFVAKL